MEGIYFYSKQKEYQEFSNFYNATFTLDGVTWPNVETYFQAAKFNQPETIDYYHYIRLASTARKAMLMGKQQKHFRYVTSKVHPVHCTENMNDLIARYKHYKIREDWHQVKETIMHKAVYAKFSQNETLKKLLLSTEPRALYEKSNDAFWGIGKNREGLNKLGQILVRVRQELKLQL